MQIDRWRPLVRKESGFSMIMWKQQGLLCVLVSDLVSDDDLGKLKEYFVKVRSSTEPYAIVLSSATRSRWPAGVAASHDPSGRADRWPRRP